MTDFPIFYANTTISLSSHGDVFQSVLGVTGYTDEGARPVVGLALPLAVANKLAGSLASAIREKVAAEGHEAEDWEDSYNKLRTSSMRMTVAMFGMKHLIKLLASDAKSDPSFRERLDRHLREVVRDLKGIEIEGMSITDESDLLTAGLREAQEWIDSAIASALKEGDG